MAALNEQSAPATELKSAVYSSIVASFSAGVTTVIPLKVQELHHAERCDSQWES